MSFPAEPEPEIEIVREDDTGRTWVNPGRWPSFPLPGDIVRIDEPRRNLDGRFVVKRREFGARGVKLIVEAGLTAP